MPQFIQNDIYEVEFFYSFPKEVDGRKADPYVKEVKVEIVVSKEKEASKTIGSAYFLLISLDEAFSEDGGFYEALKKSNYYAFENSHAFIDNEEFNYTETLYSHFNNEFLQLSYCLFQSFEFTYPLSNYPIEFRVIQDIIQRFSSTSAFFVINPQQTYFTNTALKTSVIHSLETLGFVTADKIDSLMFLQSLPA